MAVEATSADARPLVDAALRSAILRRQDAQLADVYRKQSEYKSLRSSADDLAATGLSDQAEINRVLGAEKSPANDANGSIGLRQNS